MSVRSERSVDGMPTTDSIGTLPMFSDSANTGALDHVGATIAAAQSADSALGETGSISTNHPEHPLRRTMVCNIRASLADLCLRKQRGSWAPTGEALRAILQCAHAALNPLHSPCGTHTHTHTSFRL